MHNKILAWARTSPARHGLAVSAAVVALGGMVLLRGSGVAQARGTPAVDPPGALLFRGAGAQGNLALSQRVVLAGSEQRFFAEIKLRATEGEGTKVRAPLSLVVAIDTSGSMEGQKIDDARRAVARLLSDMRDDDEIALVRFASDAEVLQPLARVGPVRARLLERVAELVASGGTAIPEALRRSLEAIGPASSQRVRRLVLASDGIDSGREAAAQIARQAATAGLVVSSLGIGLDFDEAYLGAVAQAGGGNFGFVREGNDLARFLKKELEEGATTTLQAAQVRLTLPAGVRLVHAAGAEARADGPVVTLALGSLFAGDERRVVVELAAELTDGQRGPLEAVASWDRVGSGHEQATLGSVAVVASTDAARVAASRDGAVLASVTSVTTSRRQMEAIEAYNRGDEAGAQRLIDRNIADLQAAKASAPAPLATALESQSSSYAATGSSFRAAKPSSPLGKDSAKKSAEKNVSNLYRSKF